MSKENHTYFTKEAKISIKSERRVEPDKIQPGIYFIEVGEVVTQKVVKIK